MGYKSLAQMPAHRNGPVNSNVRPHQTHTVSIHSAPVISTKTKLSSFYAWCISSEIHKQERQEPQNFKSRGGDAVFRRRRIGRLEYKTEIANSRARVKWRAERKALASVHSVGGACSSNRFKSQRCFIPIQYVLNQLSLRTIGSVGAA